MSAYPVKGLKEQGVMSQLRPHAGLIVRGLFQHNDGVQGADDSQLLCGLFPQSRLVRDHQCQIHIFHLLLLRPVQGLQCIFAWNEPCPLSTGTVVNIQEGQE